MTNSSFANRGQDFETFIRFANDRYRMKKLAVISKQSTEFIPLRDRRGKICGAKVEVKATVDFLGRYRHYPIAIEAKKTSTDSIRWDAVQPHQADFMDAFTSQPGTIGMVVVSFGMKRFFAIPWVFWQQAYNARVRTGRTRTTHVEVKAFGETWTIPNKFSVRMDEIPASFEIPDYDPKYGLHYLMKAEQYIMKEK